MIVHILHHGLPLCRFSDKPPCDWPDGHRWVGKDERMDATCAGCIACDIIETVKRAKVPE
jgi:hypothetical protein